MSREYDTDKHVSLSDRRSYFGMTIVFAVLTAISYHWYGGDVWLSRLLLVATLCWAVLYGVFLLRYHLVERRRAIRSQPELVWFWSSDRDADDQRVV
mgnify:FL=1